MLLWYTRFTEADPARAAALVAPLLREDPRLWLAVVGEEIAAGAEARLRRAFAEAGVGQQIRWLGYESAALERVATSAEAPVVAIYPFDDDPVNRARCPSKVPQLMALGLPIVAERVGEVAAYLEGFEEECLVPPGDGSAFRDRVTALLRSPEAADQLATRLHAAARRWRWERTAGGLAEWYSRLARGRAAPVA
jgi:glycosyltransferase involved in cell wall biosynthesis